MTTTEASVRCAGARLIADPSGALIWPERSLVVIADLHLEKGSAFARRGTLLPPYDTRTTLARLETLLARHRPGRVISLGDAFHDVGGARRLAVAERARLRRLIAAHDWLWVLGNHDPQAPEGLGGQSEEALEVGGVTFRHCPDGADAKSEIAGHLHPKASITVRGRRLSRPCFVGDRHRLVVPAFGSYTGGLDVRAPAIAGLFAGGFAVRILGRRRVHLIASVE